MSEEATVPKGLHDRQVEVLQNIIGAMLRIAGQDRFESHLRELDAFGDAFRVVTEVTDAGVIRVTTMRHGVLPARPMPTIPFGHLRRMGRRNGA